MNYINSTPVYTLEKLQEEYKSGKEINYIFFWGHTPSNDGRISSTCLSQWWISKFTVDNIEYCCMEQYMMAQKARLFHDPDTLNKIMNCNEPKRIKELGRQVKNFSDSVWEKERYSIIVNGNYEKFTQISALKKYLIQTQGSVLVEASPYDKIWGIGMRSDELNVKNPLLWRGQNLLGFALMEVRNEIKE
jgi:ribA/ribD-fused uncharacterized protein